MFGLQQLEPLAGLAGLFAIGIALAQAPDQLPHLLLTLFDRALQALAGHRLLFLLEVLLLLPALQQFLVEQFGPHQQGGGFFGGLLLALALVLQAADHRVNAAGALGLQQRLRLAEHRLAEPQAPGHRQGIATAGDPPEQAIGGPQACIIKFH